jgi:hypothetical protein
MSQRALRGSFRQRRQADLCVIVLALLMLLNGCGSGDNRVLEETFERVYTIEPSARLTIQNRDGVVSIYGSVTGEMRIDAVKKAYSQERLNQIGIDVSTKPGAISVITKFPPKPTWALSDRSGTVDYTIVVPATAGISALELDAGEILLEGIRGREVRARLGDGRIFARNCFTNMNLTVTRGTITLVYDWWEEEKFAVRATMTQGNAWVSLPSDSAFHLLAHAAHGKIANDFNNLPVSANSSTREMKIDQIINGGGQSTVEVRVERGEIKIAEANP